MESTETAVAVETKETESNGFLGSGSIVFCFRLCFFVLVEVLVEVLVDFFFYQHIWGFKVPF